MALQRQRQLRRRDADAIVLDHDRAHAAGVPVLLDGAQAGLSWLTILRKRDGYLSAFDGLDPNVVATYDEADVERLLADPGINYDGAKLGSPSGYPIYFPGNKERWTR